MVNGFRDVALVTALLLAPLPAARAHPLHTTLTEVRLVTAPGGPIAEFRVRAFVDDFARASAAFAGRPAPRDSSVVVVEAARYLAATMALSDARGRRLRLQWCGMRTERGVVWLCLRTVEPVALDQLAMRQRAHMELFGDQVNLVQVFDGARRVSHLFVRGTGARKLL